MTQRFTSFQPPSRENPYCNDPVVQHKLQNPVPQSNHPDRTGNQLAYAYQQGYASLPHTSHWCITDIVSDTNHSFLHVTLRNGNLWTTLHDTTTLRTDDTIAVIEVTNQYIATAPQLPLTAANYVPVHIHRVIDVMVRDPAVLALINHIDTGGWVIVAQDGRYIWAVQYPQDIAQALLRAGLYKNTALDIGTLAASMLSPRNSTDQIYNDVMVLSHTQYVILAQPTVDDEMKTKHDIIRATDDVLRRWYDPQQRDADWMALITVSPYAALWDCEWVADEANTLLYVTDLQINDAIDRTYIMQHRAVRDMVHTLSVTHKHSHRTGQAFTSTAQPIILRLRTRNNRKYDRINLDSSRKQPRFDEWLDTTKMERIYYHSDDIMRHSTVDSVGSDLLIRMLLGVDKPLQHATYMTLFRIASGSYHRHSVYISKKNQREKGSLI